MSEVLQKLKEECGWEIYVHVNGETRLQFSLVRSSGLKFDMLFMRVFQGCYNPAPENYHGALEILKQRAKDCVTVAAHTYHLRGAKAVRMKTVYVRRWTGDVQGTSGVIRRESDAYPESTRELDEAVSKV